MMSLTPMAPSAWRYYAEEIAQGREDYYARSAERPGRFVGRGAKSLGVSGREADAVALERLFGHGTDPRDGAPLGRSFSPEDSRAVAGFALTFSPPLCRIRDNGGYAECVIMPNRRHSAAIEPGQRVVTAE
jgi:hypothetical protein